MSIGQRIKEKRIRAGMTQAQLAEKIGLSTITIRQYEADKREPRYKIMEKISDALHCNVSELVDSEREAMAIISAFEDEIGERAKKGADNCIVPEHADDFVDAWDELQAPGSITQKYTEFVLKYPYIFQMLKEMGLQIKLINWHEVNICYGYQDVDIRIYELLNDVEMLDSMFRDKIKDLLKNDYGFEIEDDEQKEDDNESDSDKE